MTPQVQQVFVASMAGPGVSPAPLPDINGDDAGQALGDPGGAFFNWMQTPVAGALSSKVALPPPVPHPVEFGAQAAVAMAMLTKVRDPDAGDIVAPDDTAAVLAGKTADPVADLLPGPVLPQTALVQTPLPPVVAHVPVSTAPPGQNQPSFVVPTTPLIAGEPLRPTTLAIKSGDLEPPIARKAEENAAFVLAAMPLSGPANPGPAFMTELAQVAPAPMAAIAQAATEQVTAAIVMPSDDADIAQAPATDVHQNKPRVTLAETAFRLRAGDADINGPAKARAAVAQTPDPATLQPLPVAADAVEIPEVAAVPPLEIAADALSLLPAISGADLVKLTSVAPAQPSAISSASPPIMPALPPRLTADLVGLAKTLPNAPVEILLNPQELGQLRFEIHQDADQLRVILSVERPETMDLLRRNADQLLGEFRAAGFAGAQLSFGQWDQQSNDPRAPPAPLPAEQDRAVDPPPPKNFHPAPELAAPTGLNILL